MNDSVYAALDRDIVSTVRDVIRDFSFFFKPRIQGVEVTQAIQHYRAASHLTDPADRGADNSIRLVARKAAWVRVYVRLGVFQQSPTQVSGTLEVERRIFGFVWNTVGTYNPQPPGSLTVAPTIDYATERSNIANTLNFVIPSDEFYGNLRITVRLTGTGGGSVLDTDTRTLDVSLRQTLRIRAILVSYNGPSTANPGPPPPANI